MSCHDGWAHRCCKCDRDIDDEVDLNTLQKQIEDLKSVLQDFAEGDCEYGDGCPSFGTRHGRCISCKAKKALAAGENND
jgi:hypothetical protein